MNNIRRRNIDGILAAVTEVQEMIENVLDEEQEAFDTMHESIQNSERGDTAQEAIEALENAINSCEELSGLLQDAQG